MTLADYTFTLNGLTFGAGTAYEVITVEGLGQQAVVSDLPLIGGGVLAARDVKPPKTITFTVDICGTPGSDLASKRSAWATAWQVGTNTDVALTWHFEGDSTDRHVNGRPRRWDFTLNQPAAQGIIRVAAEFFVPDGTIYNSSNAAVPI